MILILPHKPQNDIRQCTSVVTLRVRYKKRPRGQKYVWNQALVKKKNRITFVFTVLVVVDAANTKVSNFNIASNIACE